MLIEQKIEIINILSICAKACEQCARQCLQRKDHPELAKCISLNADCEMMCRNAAAVIGRGSEYSAQILRECIEVCRLCLRESERVEHIEHCRLSVGACTDCIRICEKGLQDMA